MLQVRDGGPGEDPPVGALGQVGEDEPLPVAGQHVLAAAGWPAPGRTPGAGALGGGGPRRSAAGARSGPPPPRGRRWSPCTGCGLGPTPTATPKRSWMRRWRTSICTWPMRLGVDLPAGLVPHQVELGVLLLQLAEFGQEDLGVHLLRQEEAVGDHRLQQRRGRGGGRAPGPGRGRCWVRPRAAHTWPGETVSTVWNLAPEYRRSWVTFSSTPSSPWRGR